MHRFVRDHHQCLARRTAMRHSAMSLDTSIHGADKSSFLTPHVTTATRSAPWSSSSGAASLDMASTAPRAASSLFTALLPAPRLPPRLRPDPLSSPVSLHPKSLPFSPFPSHSRCTAPARLPRCRRRHHARPSLRMSSGRRRLRLRRRRGQRWVTSTTARMGGSRASSSILGRCMTLRRVLRRRTTSTSIPTITTASPSTTIKTSRRLRRRHLSHRLPHPRPRRLRTSSLRL
ncbi:hypothetical protein C8F01DRAFT_639786 [Mycena amicta]|nr:hypothetical protein C8F01DRAFT_639786 [Mycena amicta]